LQIQIFQHQSIFILHFLDEGLYKAVSLTQFQKASTMDFV